MTNEYDSFHTVFLLKESACRGTRLVYVLGKELFARPRQVDIDHDAILIEDYAVFCIRSCKWFSLELQFPKRKTAHVVNTTKPRGYEGFPIPL